MSRMKTSEARRKAAVRIKVQKKDPAGLLVAGTVHVAKAGVLRPIVTATTGGVANTPVSIAEDVTSTLLSVLSILMPIVIGTLLIVLVAFLFYWLSKRAERRTT